MENDKGGWVECQMYVWRAPTCYKSERDIANMGLGSDLLLLLHPLEHLFPFGFWRFLNFLVMAPC